MRRIPWCCSARFRSNSISAMATGFVSLVAFTLVRMRPRIGGKLGEWLLKPIATHEFLNVRTYVRHRGEPGIFFLAEWLPNRLSVLLGPRSFGLPYRHGRLRYTHSRDGSIVRGSVEAKEGRLGYEGKTHDSAFRAVCGRVSDRIHARALHRFHAARGAAAALPHLARTVAPSPRRNRGDGRPHSPKHGRMVQERGS